MAVSITIDDPDFLIGSLTDYRVTSRYFTARTAELSPGELGFGVAHPLLDPRQLADIQTLAFRTRKNGTLVFRGSVPARRGMSGSPVISAAGELIGILSGYEVADPRSVYVTPISAVEALYRAIRTAE